MINKPPVDKWKWGQETILWGYDPSHRFTCKVLEPKKGRDGCLSLQYHNEKSELWICFRGIAWILVVIGEDVCTRLLRQGDVQQLDQGVIHRLMGVTDDVMVIEPSTPDVHAANKSLEKDVVRLHCVFGRECKPPRDEREAKIIKACVMVTEEAIANIEKGVLPEEINKDKLVGKFSLL